MESEWPYKTEEFGELWTVRGPCGNMPFTNEEDADFYRVNINAAYSEGRKAERERCVKIAESEPVNQDEWGNIVFGLGEKIAEKIRGGQDGE